MTSGTFTAALLELSPRFERESGHHVVAATTTMGVGENSIPNRLRRHEPADVVILDDDAMTQLIADGTVIAGSRTPLARSGIGMAVRAGAPRPDISTVEALRRTLLAARSIAYSASVSGRYLTTELFQRLGIAEQMAGKSRRIDGERVGAVVARGEAELGFSRRPNCCRCRASTTSVRCRPTCSASACSPRAWPRTRAIALPRRRSCDFSRPRMPRPPWPRQGWSPT